MNGKDFVTAKEAASILERDYSHIRWLVRKGVLREIVESERKRWFVCTHVERIASERRAKFERAAA